ncbi:MAG: DUF488 domain-containing protein [Pseudomonadota bacterium]
MNAAAESAPLVRTVGYERATQAELIERLRAAGVALLIDVRAVAASRRAGFAKTLLRESLAAAGIDYLHLRALGTPKPGREAARAGRIAEMRSIFAAQLETPEALDAFARLEAEVTARPAALLCFCAEAERCHRRALTERLEASIGARIEDL